MKTQKIS